VPATHSGPPLLLELAALVLELELDALLELASPPIPLDVLLIPPVPVAVVPMPPLPPALALLLLAVVALLVAVSVPLDELVAPPVPPVPPLVVVPVPVPSVNSSSPRITPQPLGASVTASEANR
jgi:hypothetical protein